MNEIDPLFDTFSKSAGRVRVTNELLQDAWEPAVREMFEDSTRLLSAFGDEIALQPKRSQLRRRYSRIANRLSETWDVLLHGAPDYDPWDD